MYWYNPFFIWFYLGLVALLLITIRKDRMLYYVDLIEFVRSGPNMLLKLISLLIIYMYLPLTIPMNFRDMFRK